MRLANQSFNGYIVWLATGGYSGGFDPQQPINEDIFYWRGEFYMLSEDIDNGEELTLFEFFTGDGTACAAFTVSQTGGNLDGNFYIDDNGSGTLGTVDTTPSNLSTSTKYTFEFLWDSVNEQWEWRFDGSSQGSGSLTGGATGFTIRDFIVGCFIGTQGSNFCSADIVFDNLGYSTEGWPGVSS